VSLIELLIVFCVVGIITAAALPQLVASRRLVRTAAIPRQILAEMRLARQQAITQQQAFTVQYDDVNKQIIVINHQASGAALLDDPNYPDTTGSIHDRVIALSGSGLSPAEILYGIPTSLPATARGSLDDGVARTKLTKNQVSVTFQPNGSVVDKNGNPANKALFLYNSNDPDSTACAISILGAAGRVKTWTYSSSAKKYVE
jgi:Tfp pilus assembly protein FimT